VPIRIYALAKELNIDSKELVDVCTRAGVTGKGSALANLTDEEVDKVKAHLAGGRKASGAAAGPVAVAVAASGPGAPPTPFTREDYIAPATSTGKVRVIEQRPSKPPVEGKPKEPDAEGGQPPAKKQPVVRMAAIPTSGQVAPPPRNDEPAPQKPIMTLPPDAMRSARAGSKAPLEVFRSGQTRGKAEPAKKPAARPAGPVADEGPLKTKTGRERRRAKDVEEVPEGDRLAGMASARVTRPRRVARPVGEEEETVAPRRSATRLVRRGTSTAAPRKGKIVLELPCTVRTFSEATGVPTSLIQKTLLTLGSMVTINAQLESETAELLAAELHLEVEFKLPATLEDTVLSRLQEQEDDPAQVRSRPPIVTFLGHVDHGKTSLLDRIIGINVVSGEAGGITQHIRAYKIKRGEREISFVDTPGHEAFTEMRARGANVTDIAVLVVAADDGVMPQTEEAISHARAAGVPIVVALNKCDLPGADPQRVLQQLSAHELLPTQWGGDVEVVQTSAATLLLTAELHEFRANPERPARGTCIEAQQEGARGVVAKLVVRQGCLRVGDIVVCGTAFGRVKAMYDTLDANQKLEEAGPSTPVNITGLDVAPEAGEAFYVLQDIAQARQIADDRRQRTRQRSLAGRTVRVSFEEFQRRLEEGSLGASEERTTLNLILRADVRGSIEAILKELGKLEHPEVQINILQATVGAVSVADVTLADASDAVIVAFNVIPDEAARSLADERGVEIRRYDIIYRVTADLKALLEGKLKPEQRVAELGRALVQRIFSISRVGTVAGCRVLAGTIERGCRIRVHRDGRGIGDYPLESLRREKDDAREVREGFECGMKLVGFNDLKEGDILEAFKIEEVARTL
jgi:translation initiation factor IF-2